MCVLLSEQTGLYSETVSKFPVGEAQDGVTYIHFKHFILCPGFTWIYKLFLPNTLNMLN